MGACSWIVCLMSVEAGTPEPFTSSLLADLNGLMRRELKGLNLLIQLLIATVGSGFYHN